MTVPNDVEALIADARLSAHLATSVDDRPHVAPVWYVYENGTVWVLTGGRKLANVRQNPRVALSIERYDADGVDWSVQLLGTARIVADEERVEEVRARLDETYGGEYAADGGGDIDSEEANGNESGSEGDAEDRALLAIDVATASRQRY